MCKGLDVRRTSANGISRTIIVIDSRCNQSVSHISSCKVLHYYCMMFEVTAAFDSKSGSHLMQLMDVVLIVKIGNTWTMMRLYECLLDTNRVTMNFFYSPTSYTITE